MTLRTVTVPNPDPGFDWFTVVPGQYVYDITGITATLSPAVIPSGMVDYTGNGNDGVYVTPNDPATFGAGAFTGDDALILGINGNATSRVGWTAPGGTAPLGGDFSIVYWRADTSNFIFNHDLFYRGATPTDDVPFTVAFDGSLLSNGGGTNPFVQSAPAVFPFDGTWHMVGFTFDSGTGLLDCYLDGVLLTPASQFAGTIAAAPPTAVEAGCRFPLDPSSFGSMDEYAYFATNIGPTGMADLYATAPVFADWTAAVLAGTATCAYHLDGSGTSPTGRQVSLVVAQPSLQLQIIPSGEGIPSGSGPFRYSWSPQLPASTQTADGTLTSVATPRLILPAGYSVGTLTDDIQLLDQWSDITVWWDDALSGIGAGTDPFVYPPGATLIIVPKGAAG